MVGLATLEDVLESLVGEIWDEKVGETMRYQRYTASLKARARGPELEWGPVSRALKNGPVLWQTDLSLRRTVPYFDKRFSKNAPGMVP